MMGGKEGRAVALLARAFQWVSLDHRGTHTTKETCSNSSCRSLWSNAARRHRVDVHFFTTSPPPSTRKTSKWSSIPSRTPSFSETSKCSCCNEVSLSRPRGGVRCSRLFRLRVCMCSETGRPPTDRGREAAAAGVEWDCFVPWNWGFRASPSPLHLARSVGSCCGFQYYFARLQHSGGKLTITTFLPCVVFVFFL